MAQPSRKSRGPNLANSVQLCLFDAQIALDAVRTLEAELVKEIKRAPSRALVAAYRIIREERGKLALHNAHLVRLLEAA